MATKRPKSLKSRIDALINAAGESPPPSIAKIKGELINFATLAEALEDGEAMRQAEARVRILETALEKSKVENGNLKAELQAAKTEVKALLAERKAQEENKRDIPPIQFKILKRLPSQADCKWLKVAEVAQAVKIPVDEAEVYINGLENLGLIVFHHHDPGGGGWHRTSEGNKFVVAKRWAGEEAEDQKTYKYADLPSIQHEALLMMLGSEEGAIFEHEGAYPSQIAKKLGKSLRLIEHHLELLGDAEMATDGDGPDYGAECAWIPLRKGNEYLAERDLL